MIDTIKQKSNPNQALNTKIPMRRFILSPTVEDKRDIECDKGDFNKIGSVSMGYLGRMELVINKSSQTNYNIKIIQKSRIKNDKAFKAINDQLKLMYTVNHALFYRILNHFEDKENLYVIFQSINTKGTLLEEIINNQLNMESILSNFYEVLIALSHLHSLNIYNNSLEPENILLLDSHIKLTDYGWSKITDTRLNKRNAIIKDNTNINAYTPPEVIDSIKEKVDRKKAKRKSDIWQLGILLYEMITKVTPFNNTIDLIGDITKGQIDYSIIPKDYGMLKVLLMKMLQRNIDNRIDLEAILSMDIFKDNVLDLPSLELNEEIILNKKRKAKESEAFLQEVKESEILKQRNSALIREIAEKESNKRTLEFKIQKYENSLKEKDKEINKLNHIAQQYELIEQNTEANINKNYNNIDDFYKEYLPLFNASVNKLRNSVDMKKKAQEESKDLQNKIINMTQNTQQLYVKIHRMINSFIKPEIISSCNNNKMN